MPRAAAKKKKKHEPRGTRRKELGESRGIYVKATVDDDFLALSVPGKLLWYTLKMHLGASGIGVMMQGTLSDLTGIPHGDIEGTLQELEGRRWIKRERSVIWLRNGLRFDPYMTTENEVHVTAIRRHLAGLPKLPIINDFRDYYELGAETVNGTVRETVAGTVQATVGETVEPTVPDTGGRRKEVGSRKKDLGGKPVEQKAIKPPAVPTGPESRANGADPTAEKPDGFAIASRTATAPHPAADVISRVFHLGTPRVELENGYVETLDIALNRFDAFVEAKGADPLELAAQMALTREVSDFAPDEPITVSVFFGADRFETRELCKGEWIKRQGPARNLPDVDVTLPPEQAASFEAKRAAARKQLESLKRAAGAGA